MHAQTWPAIASSQASAMAYDWRIYGYGSLGMLLLIWGLILVAVVRFRKRPGNERPRSQRTTRPWLEVTWTILPVILVVGLFFETWDVERGVDALHAHPAVQIAVNAFRWGWTFHYVGGPTINGDGTHPPVMYLPLGQTAALQLTSSDVVHAFWVPDMLYQRDAVPGRVTAFDITPTKTGEFVGRCAEFCGLDHALMLFTVRVVTPAEYDHWLNEEAAK